MESGFILVLICTPESNFPGCSELELLRTVLGASATSSSIIFDLKVSVSAEQFSRGILQIASSHSTKKCDEGPSSAFERISQGTEKGTLGLEKNFSLLLKSIKVNGYSLVLPGKGFEDEGKWETNFNLLLKFIKSNGHSLFPRRKIG